MRVHRTPAMGFCQGIFQLPYASSKFADLIMKHFGICENKPGHVSDEQRIIE